MWCVLCLQFCHWPSISSPFALVTRNSNSMTAMTGYGDDSVFCCLCWGRRHRHGQHEKLTHPPFLCIKAQLIPVLIIINHSSLLLSLSSSLTRSVQFWSSSDFKSSYETKQNVENCKENFQSNSKFFISFWENFEKFIWFLAQFYTLTFKF